MHKHIVIGMLIITFVAAIGCAQKKQYHKSSLPEPSSFNAHFGDMDSDENNWVSWPEFKAHFPQATLEVYQALDLDKDGLVNHDEWHAFKEAHGMRDHN